jgi:hypothetical protein
MYSPSIGFHVTFGNNTSLLFSIVSPFVEINTSKNAVLLIYFLNKTSDLPLPIASFGRVYEIGCRINKADALISPLWSFKETIMAFSALNICSLVVSKEGSFAFSINS